MRLLAACVVASLSATLTLWLSAAVVEVVGATHPTRAGREALQALVGYLAYGWSLALLTILVGGLPLYTWLWRSGRLHRRTLLIGATMLGAFAMPAIGAIVRWDGTWGHPLLYAGGAGAGLVSGAVFAAMMRVGTARS